jgi:hypothetical protein
LDLPQFDTQCLHSQLAVDFIRPAHNTHGVLYGTGAPTSTGENCLLRIAQNVAALGYNISVANGRCCKTSGEQRCSGINAIAVKTFDWSECKLCQATGYYRNKECPSCKGSGYRFEGVKDKATTSESATFR